jgi:FkbM family methyltransferase
VLGLIRQSTARLWDAFRRGPELRRLIRRVQKLEVQSKEARAKWEAAHAGLKRRSATHHRRVLSPDIVRSLLASRVATIPARAVRADARVAAAQLEAVSAAYREASERVQESMDGLMRTDLDGLTWWVPLGSEVTGAARDRFVAKQRFPYRNITQAREFAVGPVMLDVGANTGRMSIPRVILGDFVQAYCAEPDPLNYAALVRNVLGNGLKGLVLPDRVAIGAATGSAFLRHAKYSGGHHLVRGGETSDAIEVPCCSLDDWCDRLSIDPDLVTYVKVDTQGWEMDVMQGAPRLLARRHIAWQLEISPALLSSADSSASDVYRMCAGRFSHFIDLGKAAEGPRARRTTDLSSALEYVGAAHSQTDIILFNTA